MKSSVKSYVGVHDNMLIKVVNIHDKNEYVNMNDNKFDWIVQIDKN